MKIVIALGGNALLRRGEAYAPEAELANIRRAADEIAGIAGDHEVLVTHGNGPEVGLLAAQGLGHELASQPLDVLGAQTEGWIGYLLEQELSNALPEAQIASLVTRVLVAPKDPAFRRPSKPIGLALTEPQARAMSELFGINVAPDGEVWRRVVASPEPRHVVELDTIRLLLFIGTIVICAGGGGIPIVRSADGRQRGVEAVIDKDLTAALLAGEIEADVLLMLTDVQGIERGFGTPEAELIAEATPAEIRALELPAGSMGPKAEAGARFAEGGGTAIIAALGEARDALTGSCGTRVVAESPSGAAAPAGQPTLRRTT